MKKVVGLFLSLIVLMGLSACEQELPEEPQKPNPEESMCLTFVSSGESSVTLVKVGKPFDISLEYSLDGTNWNPYTIGETIYLLEDKLSFRAGEQGNGRFSKGIDDYYQFVFSGEIAARGSIMSLLDRSCRKNVIPSYAFYYLFRDCTGLTKAPELPVTNLAERCYYCMFTGCTSLNEAPELPAMKLAEGCYSGMFTGCTSLNEAPELPAMKLAEGCYSGMFTGCTSLNEAPELPAMKLAEGCYSGMFTGCTNLSEAPVLPATEMADGCYSNMFFGCTNLTEAPTLPATELASGCYDAMFKDCTKLIKAPELPATKLVKGCYSEMFKDCTNLNYVKALFTNEPSEETTKDWLSGVSPTGTFVKSKDATWHVRGDNGIPKGWTIERDTGTSDDSHKPNPDESLCLTFVSSGESTIALIKEGNPFEITLEYSIDGEVWEPYTIGKTVELVDGGKLMFRAGEEGNEKFSAGYEDYYKFDISGEIAARGNIMSLLDRSCNKKTVPRHAFNSLFRYCEALTSAPALPATELAEYCYNCMFWGCTSLTKAPALPATELADNCYYYMFYGCTNLTEAPALPATVMKQYCYYGMLRGCTSLTKAPELPAMNLASGCYSEMFLGCESLTEAPVLPATELVGGCYESMFRGCTSLTEAPTLPATQLASCCYSCMFWHCTSLTEAPALPAMKLADGCYGSLFAGCKSLNYVKALFTDEPSEKTTGDWLLGVSFTGTFVKSKDAKWDVRGSSGIPEGWTIESDAGTSDDPQKPNPDESSYLTFVSSGESTIALIKEGDPFAITLEYSVDGDVWEPYTIGETVKLSDGEELMFRAGEQGNDFFSSNDKNYYNFKITGSVAAKGNIMSLLDRSCHKNRVPRDAFSGLFANCRSLISAPELPARELAEECYYRMFYGCTRLKKAPELPATELAVDCYASMFSGCTNLIDASALPATKLAEKCYSYMFSLCKNLTKAPELPATELAERCYWGMFSGCARLTEAPELPATELALHCYNYMFGICESLTKAPALPATILAEGCYFGMFEYSNLVKAPVLPATELAQSCYRGMFWGCSNLTEAPVLPATELVASCYSNMFGYCTGLTKAPELPATELAASCYYSMFEGCRNLKFVKALFTDKPSEEATKNWLSGVSYTGIFVKSKDATWDVRGDDGIPYRWTIVSDTGTSDDSQKPNPGETGCLTFVSSGGSSVTLVKVGKPYEITLEYSLDGKSWIPYTIGNTLNVIDGWELMFRAGEEGNANFSAGLENNYKFIFSGEIAARGNIMSLLDRSCHKNAVPRYAFSGLFANCRSLISAPELPATELAQDCYSFMFSGCKSLTKAPELPATELAERCYSGMFNGCTSLTKAPELPATELAEYCYYNIFYGCKNLTEAPALHATELAEGCYGSMFNGCTSLTKAPELPATELDPYCYFEMFKGCTSLNYVKALFIYEPFNGATDNWLLGVSPTGTFVKSKDAKWDVRGSSGIPEGWTIESDAGTSDEPQKPNPDKPSYLTFVSTGESAVSLVKNGEPALITLEYSTNDSVWTPYTIGETISLLDGEKLMFRAGEQGNNFFSSNDENYYNFKITGSVAARGNIMSLLDKSCQKNTVPSNAFNSLFKYCRTLTSAPALPAMKLASGCYFSMFAGCTSLTKTPELPATELAEWCYFSMFWGCTSLTKAPDLPATELAEYCYSWMFKGCTSLMNAPALPAMELAKWCYSYMFEGCTSLTKAPDLPARELAGVCYFSMFEGCTSLTEAPELPATELVSSCYAAMFAGCTSLTKAPALPVTELAPGCYSNMFHGCTNLTKAPELPATELAPDCYTAMFAGCTSLKKAPVLPATKLVAMCYSGLFQGCNSLNYVKALFTDEPSVETTENWLSSVSSTGTFVKSQYATWDVRGYSGIPYGWTVESDAGTSDDPQKPNPDEPSYLTFVSSGESTIALIKEGEPFEITLEYSLNGTSWIPYTIGKTLELLDREKLMFRAGMQGNAFFSLNASRYYHFKISGSVAARGNIMSLLDRKCERNSVPIHAFNSLFKYCEALTSAPVLPATELSENCYYCMFRGCTSLTKAPALPAKVMAKVCYSGMFWGCTSLMKAPALPAMELAEYCYGGMFRDCTSLTEAPELPATELASMCYGSMFSGCTSLTEAPALPARELAKRCYARMFFGCTNLNYVKALFTDEPSVETTENWLSGVSHTGTFVKSKDATWDVMGVSGVPEGWTVITE